MSSKNEVRNNSCEERENSENIHLLVSLPLSLNSWSFNMVECSSKLKGVSKDDDDLIGWFAALSTQASAPSSMTVSLRAETRSTKLSDNQEEDKQVNLREDQRGKYLTSKTRISPLTRNPRIIIINNFSNRILPTITGYKEKLFFHILLDVGNSVMMLRPASRGAKYQYLAYFP